VDLIYKFAGITLYHYHHQAVERWVGLQVVSFDAETSDNGTPYKVSARREGGVLMVQDSKARLCRACRCVARNPLESA
jgi:hypothetical protein